MFMQGLQKNAVFLGFASGAPGTPPVRKKEETDSPLTLLDVPMKQTQVSLVWSTAVLQLVGGWATPLKNISQLGWLFPIYGKIKNVPNHQPDNESRGVWSMDTSLLAAVWD